MHAVTHGNTTFHYNSDLSGDVHIIHKRSGREDAYIPGEALIAFIAHHVRNQRISALEDASDAEVLGVRQGEPGVDEPG